MTDRDEARILKFLLRGAAMVAPAGSEKLLLDADQRGAISVGGKALAALARRELVERKGSAVQLTEVGKAHLRREQSERNGIQDQHRDLAEMAIQSSEGVETVTVNDAESPLRALAKRKDRNGRPFLTQREAAAGERLRSDYTRGQLMPRLGANWQAAVSSGRRDGGRGAAELTESALAARQRVDHALRAVGPELFGVLIDICCFLKGFETVEIERGWPVRSAKIVLKTALGALARHYSPAEERSGRSHILHWGAENYRPRMVGT